MVIKARPFKTRIGEVEVEGFFDQSSFAFRFYGLVTFVQPILEIGQDDYGMYAVLEEAEISNPDGFVFRLEIGVNDLLECEWGYGISLRREEIRDRRLVESILRQRGIDPDSANLVIPPRQLVGADFNPRGEVEESPQQLDPEKSTRIVTPDESILDDRVRIAAAQRVLFLPHAIRQMSRPDRMITTREVRAVIEQGVVIEAYVDDPRGASCLLLGYGISNRVIHVVCSPKSDFLAIITAYLPDLNEWSGDFKVRIKR